MDAKKVTSLVLCLICMIGVLYQVQEISVKYFKYQTTTLISIKTVHSFLPPDLSVCYPLDAIIDYERLQRITGRAHCSRSKAIGCLKWFYNHSMEVIMKKFTFDLASRLHKVAFESTKGRNATLAEYYRFQQKCISVSFGPTPISRDEMNHLSLDYAIYWITLNIVNPNANTAFEAPFVTIHDTSTLAYISSTRTIKLDFIKFNSYILKYSLIQITDLGAPYDDCYDYEDWRLTKARCIEECLTKEYEKLARVNLARTTKNCNFIALNQLEIIGAGKMKRLKPRPDNVSVRSKCARACHPACHRCQYFPSILSSTRAGWVGEGKAYIEVQANEPITMMVSVKCFPLLDYFTYLISIPSAWIGLSVLSILMKTLSLITYLNAMLNETPIRRFSN